VKYRYEQQHIKKLSEQFALKPPFLRYALINFAVVIFAAGIIVGIVVQEAVPISIIAWLAILAICAVCCMGLGLLKISRKLYIAACLSFLCFVCLGAVRLISYQEPAKNDICNFAKEPVLASIRGQVISEPYIVEDGSWYFVNFSRSLPYTSFLMKIEQIKTTIGWVESGGIVKMYIGEKADDIKAGDHLQAYCWLNKFTDAGNPGQFDKAEYMNRKNIFVSTSVKSRAGIEILGNEQAGFFMSLRNKLRTMASEALVGDLPDENGAEGMLAALLLGKRGRIDRETADAFIKTGLYHFVSLSGLHVGIFVGFVWWLCRKAGLMKPSRAVVCLICLGIFVMVVPPRAPTMRAAVICLFYCIGLIIYRKLNPYNALALAAIVILLVRPMEIYNVGFQLSFATVLGILLFTNNIKIFLYEKFLHRFKPDDKLPKQPHFTNIMLRPAVTTIIEIFAIGLAAWLGGAPILLYNFYTITPLACLWTVIAFPLVGTILVLGLLNILLSFLLPTASVLLGVVVTCLADGLIWIVKFIAGLGISGILIGAVGLWFVLCCYMLLIFARFGRSEPVWIKRVICVFGMVGIVFFLGAKKYHNTKRDNLQLTVLSVGHGQCVFAGLPGGANLLFDAGSMSMSDIGSRIVGPFLAKKGINKIDAIFVSHNNIDHLNGIPEIVKMQKVGTVYTPAAVLKKTKTESMLKELEGFLQDRNKQLLPIPEKIEFGEGVKIAILWPCESVGDINEISDNNLSQVTLIEFAGVKILLCSDVERLAQEKLLKRYPQLNADILLLPHHGSRTTLLEDFIGRMDADIQIVSCGWKDYEKQTDKEALFTPRDGAVTITVDKKGSLTSETFR